MWVMNTETVAFLHSVINLLTKVGYDVVLVTPATNVRLRRRWILLRSYGGGRLVDFRLQSVASWTVKDVPKTFEPHK